MDDPKEIREQRPEALPIEQSYLSLQEAFEQAIALELMLAQRHAGHETQRSTTRSCAPS